MFSFLFKILNLLSFSNVCWLPLISIYSAILNSLACKIGFTWILFRVLDSFSSKFSIKRHIKAIIRFSFNSDLNFKMFTASVTLILSAVRKVKQTFDWFYMSMSLSKRISGCIKFSLNFVLLIKKLGPCHQIFSSAIFLKFFFVIMSPGLFKVFA